MVVCLAAVAAIALVAHRAARTGFAASQSSSGYATNATAGPSSVAPGGAAWISVVATSAVSGSALIDIEVYGPAGRVTQSFYDGQTFSAGQTRAYHASWRVPAKP